MLIKHLSNRYARGCDDSERSSAVLQTHLVATRRSMPILSLVCLFNLFVSLLIHLCPGQRSLAVSCCSAHQCPPEENYCMCACVCVRACVRACVRERYVGANYNSLQYGASVSHWAHSNPRTAPSPGVRPVCTEAPGCCECPRCAGCGRRRQRPAGAGALGPSASCYLIVLVICHTPYANMVVSLKSPTHHTANVVTRCSCHDYV